MAPAPPPEHPNNSAPADDVPPCAVYALCMDLAAQEFKEGLDDSSKKGGQRDWVQVGDSQHKHLYSNT